MERSQIDAEHVVARYLAGQLSPADETGFEEYAAHHPEAFREVETALRLKEGLAVLRERGELQDLLRERDWRPSFIAVAAAVLLAAVLGIWSWRHAANPRASILAGSPVEFSGNGAGQVPVIASYTLIRSRGQTSAVEFQRPAQRAAIRIRILPSLFAERGRYRAGLERIEANGARTALRETGGLEAADDGFVTLYLDSSQLMPGEYEISLTGSDSKPTSETDRFTLRVK